MPIFKYKVTNSSNRVMVGLIEANNIDIAFDILKEKGYNIINIKKNDESRITQPDFLTRVKTKDLVIFSRQFSVLVSANISIVQSLKILIDQTENPKLKIILSEVADEVDGGIRLSDALAKRQKVFSEFYISVVRSGETSGKIDDVLNYLADEMEKDYDMMAKIRGAMIYPIFVFCGLIAVGILMMIFVIPKLTGMLQETGAQLPLSTRILIATSGFMVNQWWLFLLILAGLAVAIGYLKKTEQGSYFFDWLILRLPIFGKLLQRIYLVRFTRSMETLVVGGVTISSSLKIAADVVGNRVYKDIVKQTIKEVEDGNSISSIFAKRDEIPKMVSEMLSIGEKTGKLDSILAQITTFYSREINNTVANLMTLMEPLIMLIMGVAVGLMVTAIIMPMYNVASQV